MRISDWSSDVCSSDLSEVQPATEPEPTPAAVERDRPFAPSLRTAEVVDQSERLKAITTEKAQALQKLVNGELEAADYAELDNRQIGRASGRERGCKYG